MYYSGSFCCTALGLGLGLGPLLADLAFLVGVIALNEQGVLLYAESLKVYCSLFFLSVGIKPLFTRIHCFVTAMLYSLLFFSQTFLSWVLHTQNSTNLKGRI